MASLLAANRARLSHDLDKISFQRDFSAALNVLYRELVPLLKENLHGKFIDIGCGDSPYRSVIQPIVDKYSTLDIEARDSEVDYLCNVESMDSVPDESFDSAMCINVLEHVPNPGVAAKEIARILKPNGVLIVFTPFLARIHEEPHDYYRFTGYGLQHLFENAGFTCESLRGIGGVASFVTHQLSTLLVCSTWHIPVLKRVFFLINKWLLVLPGSRLDTLFRIDKFIPMGFLAVYRKQST